VKLDDARRSSEKLEGSSDIFRHSYTMKCTSDHPLTLGADRLVPNDQMVQISRPC